MHGTKTHKNIVILASGNGTNAEKIALHFKAKQHIARIVLIITNNQKAGIVEKAKQLQIPLKIVDKNMLNDAACVLPILKAVDTDFIVLSGFLKKIPPFVIKNFSGKIINIHPALLPKFGGKGMYGLNVHKAVKKAGENKTGISIHLVDEIYDNGNILFQKAIAIAPEDTPETIAKKVQQLEHRFYPEIIEQLIKTL